MSRALSDQRGRHCPAANTLDHGGNRRKNLQPCLRQVLLSYPPGKSLRDAHHVSGERISIRRRSSTLCYQPVSQLGVRLGEVKTVAFRQLVHDRPKVDYPIGEGAIRTLWNMHPVQLYIRAARSLA